MKRLRRDPYPPPDYGWPWGKFKGSPEALKWNRRDLPVVDAVLKVVQGRTAAVQAGGNLGLFPKRLAQVFGAVYTFEPHPDNFVKLMFNAPEANIVKFQAALGDERRLVRTSMTRRDGKENVHEGIAHVAGPGIVPTLRIDDLALPVCDLIYLDTEGDELFGLRGAVETIQRCRPVIAVEINKNLGYVGLQPDDVIGWVMDQGYQERANIGHTMHKDRLFVPQERAA